MHPVWTLRPTFPQCKDNFTLCHVQYTFLSPSASLCVAPQPNSAAIGPSSRLASPAPHRSRCSRGSIHGLRMSVIHLETGRDLLGGALQVLYLAQGLQERGVNSVVMVPKGSEVAEAARKRWLRVEEFTYRGRADALSLARLAWRFSRSDVQLVHVHWGPGADSLGAMAATAARAPVILTRRAADAETEWMVGAKYGVFHRVVAISGAVRDLLVEHGVPAEKIALVRDAVDASDWQESVDAAERNSEFELEPGVPAGAMVAQFLSRKGHWVLIDALAILKRRGVAPTVVFFGGGPREETVRTLAEVAGVEDRIRFAGFRDDLHRWLGSFDFCVLPALSEGLGGAALQAGAAGVPVIGARAGGLPEVIEHGRTGVLCPPGDAGALATAIAGIVEDREGARAMGERARQRVGNLFPVGAMVTGNLDVYREVVRGRG
ncbi:MAG: glycosyltransferase family 4 protein [Gemmatimonadetes bacterium]|nr:glycosyltransferase family 4 protein [Gemmatimonadota bacterium]